MFLTGFKLKTQTAYSAELSEQTIILRVVITQHTII